MPVGCTLMGKGIQIIFKDGTKDWFDPCDGVYIRTGDVSWITRELQEYSIKVDDIESISTYETEMD